MISRAKYAGGAAEIDASSPGSTIINPERARVWTMTGFGAGLEVPIASRVDALAHLRPGPLVLVVIAKTLNDVDLLDGVGGPVLATISPEEVAIFHAVRVAPWPAPWEWRIELRAVREMT